MRVRKKRAYTIDGVIYSSKSLVEYHQELAALKKKKVIKNFELPNAAAVGKLKSKFRAIKVVIDGIVFDSINESRYYLKLLTDKKAKTVKSFELQVPFELIPSYKKNGKTIRKTVYIADFVVHHTDGTTSVIDVKGIETDVFKIKHKLFEYKYPNLTLTCCRYVAALKKFLTLKEYKEYIKAKKK